MLEYKEQINRLSLGLNHNKTKRKIMMSINIKIEDCGKRFSLLISKLLNKKNNSKYSFFKIIIYGIYLKVIVIIKILKTEKAIIN